MGLQINNTTQQTNNNYISNQSQMGKDEFLKLLIVKLQNQDPLNPTDDESFIADLAQFSSLEQMENMNGSLKDLAMLQSNSTNTSMVNYIGKTAILSGNIINLKNSSATINYELPQNAQKIKISIYSENGKLIKTINKNNIQAGNNFLEWNGRDERGNEMPQGKYTVKITATDSKGNSIPVITRMTGKIEGITYENGYPELIIGGKKYSLNDLISISE